LPSVLILLNIWRISRQEIPDITSIPLVETEKALVSDSFVSVTQSLISNPSPSNSNENGPILEEGAVISSYSRRICTSNLKKQKPQNLANETEFNPNCCPII
jgi:hypothetical protein